MGEVFHSLARHMERLIEEGHLMSGHVHMMISILPKSTMELYQAAFLGNGVLSYDSRPR